ncbi:hypothetical protein E4P36_38100 [Streptomyces sp. 4R-3d]|nr:hypothetical protein E4P36_38100 [Streptomyces sp. 4R-3d]
MQALDNLITSGEYADILKAQGLEGGAVTKAGIVHHVLGGEAEHRHRGPRPMAGHDFRPLLMR